MKQFAKQFLRDSLAIIYFIIGWKLGGCLLSEQPRHGESNGRPNRGADQFAEDASHDPAKAATETALPFVEGGVAGGREALADEDGLVVPEGIGLPADEQPAPLKLNGGDGVRPAELHVPAGVAYRLKEFVVTSLHAENDSTNAAARASATEEK